MFLLSLVATVLLPLTLAAPPQVTEVTVSLIPGQPAAAIRVDWNEPSNSSDPITSYDVTYSIYTVIRGGPFDGTVITSNAMLIPGLGANLRTVDISNLEWGLSYVVYVLANTATSSAIRSPATITTLPNLPRRVTGVTLSTVSGEAAILVQWNKPTVKANFTSYEVEYKIIFDSWNDSRTVSEKNEDVVSVVVKGLLEYVAYDVRVRAVSNIGSGDYSSEAVITVYPIAAVQANMAEAGLVVGVFIAGLVAGALGVLLVMAIVLVTLKLAHHQPKKQGSRESSSSINAVEMTQSSAFSTEDKANENIDPALASTTDHVSKNKEFASDNLQ